MSHAQPRSLPYDNTRSPDRSIAPYTSHVGMASFVSSPLISLYLGTPVLVEQYRRQSTHELLRLLRELSAEEFLLGVYTPAPTKEPLAALFLSIEENSRAIVNVLTERWQVKEDRGQMLIMQQESINRIFRDWMARVKYEANQVYAARLSVRKSLPLSLPSSSPINGSSTNARNAIDPALPAVIVPLWNLKLDYSRFKFLGDFSLTLNNARRLAGLLKHDGYQVLLWSPTPVEEITQESWELIHNFTNHEVPVVDVQMIKDRGIHVIRAIDHSVLNRSDVDFRQGMDRSQWGLTWGVSMIGDYAGEKYRSELEGLWSLPGGFESVIENIQRKEQGVLKEEVLSDFGVTGPAVKDLAARTLAVTYAANGNRQIGMLNLMMRLMAEADLYRRGVTLLWMTKRDITPEGDFTYDMKKDILHFSGNRLSPGSARQPRIVVYSQLSRQYVEYRMNRYGAPTESAIPADQVKADDIIIIPSRTVAQDVLTKAVFASARETESGRIPPLMTGISSYVLGALVAILTDSIVLHDGIIGEYAKIDARPFPLPMRNIERMKQLASAYGQHSSAWQNEKLRASLVKVNTYVWDVIESLDTKDEDFSIDDSKELFQVYQGELRWDRLREFTQARGVAEQIAQDICRECSPSQGEGESKASSPIRNTRVISTVAKSASSSPIKAGEQHAMSSGARQSAKSLTTKTGLKYYDSRAGDAAKPRPGKTEDDVKVRFAQIALGQPIGPRGTLKPFFGFTKVKKSDLRVRTAMRFVAANYPLLRDPLMKLRKIVVIRAGPDSEEIFFGANNENPNAPVILIATNGNDYFAATLVHEIVAILTADHNVASQAEHKFFKTSAGRERLGDESGLNTRYAELLYKLVDLVVLMSRRKSGKATVADVNAYAQSLRILAEEDFPAERFRGHHIKVLITETAAALKKAAKYVEAYREPWAELVILGKMRKIEQEQARLFDRRMDERRKAPGRGFSRIGNGAALRHRTRRYEVVVPGDLPVLVDAPVVNANAWCAFRELINIAVNQARERDRVRQALRELVLFGKQVTARINALEKPYSDIFIDEHELAAAMLELRNIIATIAPYGIDVLNSNEKRLAAQLIAGAAKMFSVSERHAKTARFLLRSAYRRLTRRDREIGLNLSLAVLARLDILSKYIESRDMNFRERIEWTINALHRGEIETGRAKLAGLASYITQSVQLNDEPEFAGVAESLKQANAALEASDSTAAEQILGKLLEKAGRIRFMHQVANSFLKEIAARANKPEGVVPEKIFEDVMHRWQSELALFGEEKETVIIELSDMLLESSRERASQSEDAERNPAPKSSADFTGAAKEDKAAQEVSKAREMLAESYGAIGSFTERVIKERGLGSKLADMLRHYLVIPDTFVNGIVDVFRSYHFFEHHLVHEKINYQVMVTWIMVQRFIRHERPLVLIRNPTFSGQNTEIIFVGEAQSEALAERLAVIDRSGELIQRGGTFQYQLFGWQVDVLMFEVVNKTTGLSFSQEDRERFAEELRGGKTDTNEPRYDVLSDLDVNELFATLENWKKFCAEGIQRADLLSQLEHPENILGANGNIQLVRSALTPQADLEQAVEAIVAKGMRPVFAADMDATLTPAGGACLEPMMEEIRLLLEAGEYVFVISGADMDGKKKGVRPQFLDPFLAYVERQKVDRQILNKLVLMPCNGSKMYRYDATSGTFILSYFYSLADKIGEEKKALLVGAPEKQNDALRPCIMTDLLKEFSIPVRTEQNDHIDDRGTQVTFYGIGKGATPEEIAAFNDPMHSKRGPWADHLRAVCHKENIPVEIKIGGKTSIDILPLGIDKGFAIQKVCEMFGLVLGQIVFFGDSFVAFGNDRAATEGVSVVVNVGPVCLKIFAEGKTIFINAEEDGPGYAVRYLEIFRQVLIRHGLAAFAPALP